MSVNYIIKAYLDEVGLINLYMNSRFYNGESSTFYVKNEDGDLINVVMGNVERQRDFVLYQLLIPSDYDFSKSHYVVDSHGFQADVEIRRIVNSIDFEEEFFSPDLKLGNFYTKDYTDFALWSPVATSMAIEFSVNNKKEIRIMERSDHGVWKCRINKDLQQAIYAYIVKINGKYLKTSDPFAISGINNDEYSAVINRNLLSELKPYKLNEMNSYCDAIIYEMSIMDFTSSNKSHTSSNSKFVSLMESGTKNKGLSTSLDYLCELGVTHIQLMPVFDFATIDEQHPDKSYNWGYDPLNLMIVDGVYTTDYSDPYIRINEFRSMVNLCHQKGIRVNLDFVFNHMYNIGKTNIEILCPNYNFRLTKDNFLSNGSFCGNDLESRHKMVRHYLISVCLNFLELYDIDGIRFDLMGIMDVETVNEIYRLCSAIKPDFMVYGEGWNMPTAMNDSEKAMMYNADKLPNIAFFNDGFRDILKGKSSESDASVKGYLTGDIGYIGYAKNVMIGDIVAKFKQPTQSVNYVECHDNQTCFDKIQTCCPTDHLDTQIRKQKMLMAATMFAQGIPFFHSGQEFCRTKNGAHNTYNGTREINQMDWNRRVEYADVVDYFKDLVKFRKSHACLRLDNKKDIDENCSFEEVFGMLVYVVEDLRIYLNPTIEVWTQDFDENYELVFDMDGIRNDKQLYQKLTCPGFSVYVYQKVKTNKNLKKTASVKKVRV